MQLKFTEDILPVTDFRNNAADILTQLAQSGRPILLTQRGRASAVLLDVHEYQRMCDRLNELERLLLERPSALSGADVRTDHPDAAVTPGSDGGAPSPLGWTAPGSVSGQDLRPGAPRRAGLDREDPGAAQTPDIVRELEKWIEGTE